MDLVECLVEHLQYLSIGGPQIPTEFFSLPKYEIEQTC